MRTDSTTRFVCCLVLVTHLGCAGYAGKVRDARAALDRGQPERALDELNDALDVESAKKVPTPLKDDDVLLLLERGSVLHSLQDFEHSSRDLQVADKAVEVLDFSRKSVHEVGRYLFSDDTGPYKAPAYEKLLINTMNMLNYLARGDLSGARVEARRFTVMQRFIKDHEGHGKSVSRLGSYLAGFIFEMSGRVDEARGFYRDALGDEMQVFGHPGDSGLGQCQDRSSTGPENGEARDASVPSGTAPCADILVVLGHGRVPGKVAKRVPIGLALTFASAFMSPANVRLANRLAAQGLVTWVNYPTLEAPRRFWSEPALSLDGRMTSSTELLAVDKEAYRVWREARGPVMAAAIVRMLARAAVGAGAQAAAKGTAGILISLGTQAILTANDTPDTRSWSMLPGRYRLARFRVPSGTHKVEARFDGMTKTTQLQVRDGGFAVVSATSLR